MPNKSRDALFQLIKSLEKSEKRNFKLFARRYAGATGFKSLQLFATLDKMDDYDESLLLKRNRHISKQQLSNIKAHLHRQILASLQLISDESNIHIQFHEHMVHARILYSKGLYMQSLKLLERLKEQAKTYYQFAYWLQVVRLEKEIEAHHISKSMENRVEELAKEVEQIHGHLAIIDQLSSLSLRLYGWFIHLGQARNSTDAAAVKALLEQGLPPEPQQLTGFYECMYLYQSYTWHSFIIQDLLSYYRHSQKWVDLFEAEPVMKKIEPAHYIKGLHNLLMAHFLIRNIDGFYKTLNSFENFVREGSSFMDMNQQVQSFVYLYNARINRHFTEGTFTEGLALVPVIEEQLEKYHPQIDRHRELVFYYKIACLYVGSGRPEKALDYLNTIINWKVDLRTDLQCYSRLLYLIAHYEMGNTELLEYLVKSVYRYMTKMDNLLMVEKEILAFLRTSFRLTPSQIQDAFRQLLERLRSHQHDPYEFRSYTYLDIISWLESKIEGVTLQTIIRQKFEEQYEPTRRKKLEKEEPEFY